ncbi:MipA/OmpV family protein [Dyella sp. A6]|uniref:MipA/OmpV family protein n=1 Tax=Dyella aluminiiresistens TaxID=3069105 RepID=UPI002E7604D3|nr:MipA/OmpV family protein [Dyella sp. A6]
MLPEQHRPEPLRPALLTLATLGMVLTWAQPAHADDTTPVYAVGGGVNIMPGWSGSKTQYASPVPYFDIEVPNVISLSSNSGLQVDLIRGKVLHGGIYGGYEWGREHDDMGYIAGKVPTLSPRFDAGGYLEWQLTKNIDAGTSLSHDLDGATTYWKVYAEWDLPSVGYFEHSLQVELQTLNGAGMRRLYGINPSQAARLGTSTWQPGASPQQASLEYDVFLPTSRNTGVAMALRCSYLLGNAADSPLVRRYGTPWQPSATLAFIYHY